MACIHEDLASPEKCRSVRGWQIASMSWSLQERSPTSEGSRLRAPAPRELNNASEGEKVVTTDDSNESTKTWGPSSPSAAGLQAGSGEMRSIRDGSDLCGYVRCTSRARVWGSGGETKGFSAVSQAEIAYEGRDAGLAERTSDAGDSGSHHAGHSLETPESWQRGC
jgi:hypothetical protein